MYYIILCKQFSKRQINNLARIVLICFEDEIEIISLYKKTIQNVACSFTSEDTFDIQIDHLATHFLINAACGFSLVEKNSIKTHGGDLKGDVPIVPTSLRAQLVR